MGAGDTLTPKIYRNLVIAKSHAISVGKLHEEIFVRN
jgi:hypothetical protein